MSQYISFHLKTRDGDFLPIACFSGSNIYYEFASSYVPAYKEEAPLTKETIGWIRDDIIEAKDRETKYLADCKEKLKLIAEMNNSVEDKMEYIHDIQESIAIVNERLEELINCNMFYCTLLYMIEEAENTKWISNKERHLNPDDYIYAGIECSLPNGIDDSEE